LQSAAVVQTRQPGTSVLWHTPASQESVEHGLPSVQSAGVAHGLQPAIGVL
jgi:hypothetical protein